MFDFELKELEQLGAIHTAREVMQQPEMWSKTVEIYHTHKENVTELLKAHLNKDNSVIVFTGAGSSEYVGNSITPYLRSVYGNRILSIPTTDLLSAPWYFLKKDQPVLLVSFGRSGNSAESLGAIQTVNEYCDDVSHLVLTCNLDSAMGRLEGDRYYVIGLPPETHDQSFAMTSSFTSMMLLAFSLLQAPFDITDIDTQVQLVNKSAREFLTSGYALTESIKNEFEFDKLVYLGSHGLKYLGEECQLKALELTQGPVATAFNSVLGFRHGPKSMITDTTLTVIMLSKNAYTRQYEVDLVKEMVRDRKLNKILVVDCVYDSQLAAISDYYYAFDTEGIDEFFFNYLYILVAQVLALKISIKHGIAPDDPCPTGEVNRVVQGVTVYPLRGE